MLEEFKRGGVLATGVLDGIPKVHAPDPMPPFPETESLAQAVDYFLEEWCSVRRFMDDEYAHDLIEGLKSQHEKHKG